MAGSILFEENGNYQFDFTNAVWANGEIHEVFHSSGVTLLSDVDFVVETTDSTLFVEYKNSNINGAANPEAFKPSEEKSINKIAYKFYDSAIYIKACGHYKPYKYVYILEYPNGDSVTRKAIRNKITARLPFKLQQDVNVQGKMIERFEVLSIEEWNTSPEYAGFPIKEVV